MLKLDFQKRAPAAGLHFLGLCVFVWAVWVCVDLKWILVAFCHGLGNQQPWELGAFFIAQPKLHGGLNENDGQADSR